MAEMSNVPDSSCCSCTVTCPSTVQICFTVTDASSGATIQGASIVQESQFGGGGTPLNANFPATNASGQSCATASLFRQPGYTGTFRFRATKAGYFERCFPITITCPDASVSATVGMVTPPPGSVAGLCCGDDCTIIGPEGRAVGPASINFSWSVHQDLGDRAFDFSRSGVLDRVSQTECSYAKCFPGESYVDNSCNPPISYGSFYFRVAFGGDATIFQPYLLWIIMLSGNCVQAGGRTNTPLCGNNSDVGTTAMPPTFNWGPNSNLCHPLLVNHTFDIQVTGGTQTHNLTCSAII